MKVLMHPHLSQFGQGESGIRRVVEAYHKYLPEFGVELVNPDTYSYDLKAVHAGTASGADVAHNHGLYWTEDLELTDYEWQANVAVINSLREAKQITVPSEWVAETIRRDMRIDPHVIGHGIEWDDWQTSQTYANDYILWNKNRDFDVCNPEAVLRLAKIFPQQKFMTTFAPNPTPNIFVTGQVPFNKMQEMVFGCSVYLSSIKETFGIGTLEAMAAGKPILGWANGGNLDLVKHGVNGYLAQPGNYEDLANGLDYCLMYRKALGDNGREMAKDYTWFEVCRQVANVYELGSEEEPQSVGIVIPVYNKTLSNVETSIDSGLVQTTQPEAIIVINDGSENAEGFDHAVELYSPVGKVSFVTQNNQGVAATRNRGIQELATKYICCLDADDWIEPEFIAECVRVLESDQTIGIAYTGLQWHNHQTGESKVSDWPSAYDASKQFDYEGRQNQIPTCCVFRRDAWERVGGFRSRYCPDGAGSEDAAFWAQVLSIGYTAKQVTAEPLFNYSLGGQVSGDRDYHEVDWLAWLPYSRDKRYPFACSVQPTHYSHPVRQYDEPELSIVIPVAPGHENDLRTALDSVEAQHFRNWECIVILDTGNEYEPELYAAYPYVKWGHTDGKRGAGYARNMGTDVARGKFLLFLDADDFINPSHPNALGEMLERFWETGEGVYSAHIGRAVVSKEYADFAAKEKRLAAWNEKLGQAYILNPGIPYDCEKAMMEPGNNPDKIYIWNLISTLIPKQWHDEIGGFDEEMPTWEDWDYWLRMAKAGHCFTRIQKHFIIYNYISGNRREAGRQIWRDVLKYLQDKHKDVNRMACGCGNKKRAGEAVMTEVPMIKIRYLSRNTGKHHVVYQGTDCGRHKGGEIFEIPEPVYQMDQEAPEGQRWFEAIETAEPVLEAVIQPISEPVTLTAPQPLDLSGLTAKARNLLAANDLTTKEAVLSAGIDGLTAISGIGQATANQILNLAQG